LHIKVAGGDEDDIAPRENARAVPRRDGSCPDRNVSNSAIAGQSCTSTHRDRAAWLNTFDFQSVAIIHEDWPGDCVWPRPDIDGVRPVEVYLRRARHDAIKFIRAGAVKIHERPRGKDIARAVEAADAFKIAVFIKQS
jgi:hypothetical protein